MKHTALIKKLKAIAKEHGLKVRFLPHVSFSGDYDPTTLTARIATNRTAKWITCTFFHELGHHVDHMAGVYTIFYNDNEPLYRIRQSALRAERHADATGEKLCKKYFPRIKYDKSYRSQDEIDFLRDYFRDKRRNRKQ